MKIIKFSMLLLVAVILILSVQADGLNQLVYQYYNPEITVVFSEPLGVSPERQQEIADNIAGVSSNTIIDPNIASPDNIICTLFGHNLSPQVTVTATHHKVSQYNPRCLMEIHHIRYCQRCDYTEDSLEGTIYIVCCPED